MMGCSLIANRAASDGYSAFLTPRPWLRGFDLEKSEKG